MGGACTGSLLLDWHLSTVNLTRSFVSCFLFNRLFQFSFENVCCLEFSKLSRCIGVLTYHTFQKMAWFEKSVAGLQSTGTTETSVRLFSD